MSSPDAEKKSDPQSATAKLFTDNGSQAVLLPDEFRFEGDEVRIRRIPEGILLEQPIKRQKVTREEIRAMFARIDSYGADPLFPDGRDQGTFETRDTLD